MFALFAGQGHRFATGIGEMERLSGAAAVKRYEIVAV